MTTQHSSTRTLASAVRILSQEIASPDGVANAALAEASQRLEELSRIEANLCTAEPALRLAHKAIAENPFGIYSAAEVIAALFSLLEHAASLPQIPSVP